jgi:hypothetical protein
MLLLANILRRRVWTELWNQILVIVS